MTENNGAVPRDILNIDEAAELLGVSVKTFNKVLHSEDMPARKIGREWKFSRKALIEWVGSGRSREFYRESSAADAEAEREITPARAEKPADRSPTDRPRARRTAGWAIEMD
jgi:excisionase family DNA binding protein